ncbi:Homeobox domain [Macleaya cordata]|uniref:Homeobox domain n=1 Tax=Macleaya cordata TaxID=56857 RepID=A0A200QVK2_MACCD|nr:Homeobox domain [Macleaya cordata]
MSALRHWPSMFKSKPCNSHSQWQHEINQSLLSSCQRPSFTSVPTGCEERSPEPKPRWNPKPEQIRILEAIFNSGMVNPPRDEIRKIRAQLQEYGQVGDANVFYWFQNRKSRSKHKQRHLQNSTKSLSNVVNQSSSPVTLTAPSSSSSSSSEKSSPNRNNNKNLFPVGGVNMIDASNSPTASVNQTYFQTPIHQGEFSHDPFFFPVQQTGNGTVFTQGFCLSSELSNVVQFPTGADQAIGTTCSGILLGELLNQGGGGGVGHGESGEMGGPGVAAKSTVFINDVAFEVSVGPLNVRQAFGYDAVLIHSSGQPVLTNEWGVTLHSLQPGSFYYLVRLARRINCCSIANKLGDAQTEL